MDLIVCRFAIGPATLFPLGRFCFRKSFIQMRHLHMYSNEFKFPCQATLAKVQPGATCFRFVRIAATLFLFVFFYIL